MLIRKLSKPVYPNKSNSSIVMNFPVEAYKRFGKNYIMEIHDDKIVMYPTGAENE